METWAKLKVTRGSTEDDHGGKKGKGLDREYV